MNMDMDIKNNTLALSIMTAIIVLNTALAVNFVGASGRALAAVFNSQTIFLLAGVELIAVLVTYVVSKYKPIKVPPRAPAS